MKDLYSFARNDAEHDEIYERVKQSYNKVYERLGIGQQTFLTFASGGMFSEFSHEFQTICEAGEDTIYVDRNKGIAVNEEVNNDEVLAGLGLNRADLEEVKAAEVGNIFTLKDKFSAPLGLTFANENDQQQNVLMGCYGIGPSRLVGVIAELLADEKGLVWPASIAPFKVYLIRLGEEEAVVSAADQLYQNLADDGIEVLYDDRDERAGEKFADGDLLGIPWRVVISQRTLEQGNVELKGRTETESKFVSVDELKNHLVNN
jgi:prolyl-tRNA synthetase